MPQERGQHSQRRVRRESVRGRGKFRENRGGGGDGMQKRGDRSIARLAHCKGRAGLAGMSKQDDERSQRRARCSHISVPHHGGSGVSTAVLEYYEYSSYIALHPLLERGLEQSQALLFRLSCRHQIGQIIISAAVQPEHLPTAMQRRSSAAPHTHTPP